MKYAADKRTSKLAFLAFLVVVVYLAFFRFNIEAAYTHTVAGVSSMLSIFGL
ncbi:MAG: hypothetical protein KBC38_02785 [Candidatus Pacebacteria bacterium]|nr:hypothetical protein [Candidatus Paceibacterota bacterium]MBP9840317.1 hypothetical protein [Candidatus Paceibacterota bacterium]